MIRRVLHSFAANYIPGVVQILGPSELRWEWLKLRVAPFIARGQYTKPSRKGSPIASDTSFRSAA